MHGTQIRKPTSARYVVAPSLPQEGMGSADVSTRQGVCYGIQEVLQSVTRQQLSELLPMVLPMIQTALCDDAESVRTVRQLVRSMKTLPNLCLLMLDALALDTAQATVSVARVRTTTGGRRCVRHPVQGRRRGGGPGHPQPARLAVRR
jgi:hypothetical protein